MVDIISLIVILVFLLYYCRPRKIDRETTFKEALYWSEGGKACFIGHAILAIALSFIVPFFPVLIGGIPVTFSEIILFSWLKDPISLSLYVLPMVFAWLAHRELVKPLREDKVPSRKWSLLLSIMGLFFGLVIGFIVLAVADERIKELKVVPLNYSPTPQL